MICFLSVESTSGGPAAPPIPDRNFGSDDEVQSDEEESSEETLPDEKVPEFKTVKQFFVVRSGIFRSYTSVFMSRPRQNVYFVPHSLIAIMAFQSG